MRNRPSIGRLAVIVLLVGTVAGSAAAADAVAVVINRARAEKNVSRLDILAIFNGNAQYWGDRSEISVILPPASDLLANLVFYKFLGSSSSKLRSKWTAAVAQGRANRPPVQPKDARDALDRLVRIPAGIAVMSLSEVQGYPDSANLFTILTIDGLKPGEQGYALNR